MGNKAYAQGNQPGAEALLHRSMAAAETWDRDAATEDRHARSAEHRDGKNAEEKH